jgi:sigma-E factor negative regulatory protein RseA
MDDRLRETLSAMMDDEADELSVRRLLSHHDQDRVREQWQRWQEVRDLMHASHAPVEGVDVTSGVREALDGRPERVSAGDASSAGRRIRWRWSAVAMTALALVVGFGAGAGWESTDAASSTLARSDVTDKQPVREVALKRLDEKQWEQVSRYLLEHAQHNSVGAGQGSVGYARVVSAADPGY